MVEKASVTTASHYGLTLASWVRSKSATRLVCDGLALGFRATTVGTGRIAVKVVEHVRADDLVGGEDDSSICGRLLAAV